MSRLSLALCFVLVTSSSFAAQPPSDFTSAEAHAAFRFAVAQSLAKEGSYREALKVFAEVVELVPSEPYARLEYAEFLSRLSRWRDAAEQAMSRGDKPLFDEQLAKDGQGGFLAHF